MDKKLTYKQVEELLKNKPELVVLEKSKIPNFYAIPSKGYGIHSKTQKTITYKRLKKKPLRIRLCKLILSICNTLKGNVIELGVGGGENTISMAKSTNKTVYACDTFEGLPYSELGLHKGSFSGWSYNIFKEHLNKLGINNIKCIKGKFTDTLNIYLNKERFCFAWIDPDLGKSALTAYNFIKDKIVIGGVIGFHDYKQFKNLTEVINTTIDKNKNFKRIALEKGCIFYQKVKDEN